MTTALSSEGGIRARSLVHKHIEYLIILYSNETTPYSSSNMRKDTR